MRAPKPLWVHVCTHRFLCNNTQQLNLFHLASAHTAELLKIFSAHNNKQYYSKIKQWNELRATSRKRRWIGYQHWVKIILWRGKLLCACIRFVLFKGASSIFKSSKAKSYLENCDDRPQQRVEVFSIASLFSLCVVFAKFAAEQRHPENAGKLGVS